MTTGTSDSTRRLRMLATCVAVASTACAAREAGITGNSAATRARDVAAIQNLREQDIAATLAADPVAELWTDDVVILDPSQPPQIGKKAILAARLQRQAAAPGFRVVSYKREVTHLIIDDGWAIESGVIVGSYVVKPGAEQTHVRSKLLGVLKKQPDGSWKVAMAISIPDK